MDNIKSKFREYACDRGDIDYGVAGHASCSYLSYLKHPSGACPTLIIREVGEYLFIYRDIDRDQTTDNLGYQA